MNRMRLIDADALYEKACDLEAQALDYAVKISNDEEKREEWLRWSAILAERSAFKHDVYDAPTIEPERKTGEWIKVHGYVTFGGDPVWKCSECGKGVHVYGIEHGTYGADISDGQWVSCPNCGADMRGEQDV